MANESSLEQAWYRPASWALLLLPLSWLFRLLAWSRRIWLTRVAVRPPLDAPVIIVGNITVGGTGKTPLLLTLIDYLKQQGYKPGVISRGYGGQAANYPCLVSPQSKAAEVGDEPMLLAAKCPVAVDPDRDQAARLLLEQQDCDLLLSDDGLQHYRLQRDIEIVVVDGQRGWGNGHCLPAGPLREPIARLASVDFVVTNGAAGQLKIDHPRCSEMSIEPQGLRRLRDGYCISPRDWPGSRSVNAVAGIGNPERFFNTLAELGFEAELHPLPDHHQFTGEELSYANGRPVIITAKDAVKCTGFDQDNVWVLEVNAQLENAFLQQLSDKLKSLG